jgi:two-component system, NtrC family, sensor histidine kinase PilS
MNKKPSWQAFQIYNAYRYCLVSCLFISKHLSFSVSGDLLFNSLLINDWLYVFYGIYIGYFYMKARAELVSFDPLITFSTFIDLFFLNSLILLEGSLDTGLGVLLNVSIAAMAILIPGVMSLFFAAFESIMLLSYGYYKFKVFGGNFIFYTGIHGAGFFTTALTSLALAYWLKISNGIAQEKNREIESLRTLNGFIIQKTQSSILYVDSNRTVFFMNDLAKKLFKINDFYLGCSLSELSIELHNLLKNKTCYQAINETLLKLHGDEHLMTIIPYKNKEDTSVVIILDNQTKLMQQAHQLKLASLCRFTASIAHELRNPLSSISHASQILATSLSLSAQELRFNQIIGENCNRMNELIKNILQLSRQEKSKPSCIEVNEFLNDFIRQYPMVNITNSHLLTKKNKILFDRSQLSQLMVTLFENSIKYGKNDNGEVKLSISIKKSNANRVIFRLSDQGIGIPAKDQYSIFEPFFTTSRLGIGLGLFIAKELCMANQAKITLINPNDLGGACFEIIFVGDE